MVPGAAGGAGKATVGALAGFDALMSAVFAAADGVLHAGAALPGAGSALSALATGAQAAAGQGITKQGGAGQGLTSPVQAGLAPTGQIATGQAGDGAAEAAAALLVAAEPDAGVQPTDANSVPGAGGAPKLHSQAGKPAGGEIGKRLGQTEAANLDPAQTPKTPQTPQTVSAAQAAATDATAAAAAALIGKASAKADAAAETPPAADPLTPAQMAAAMALMTPTPAPSAAATKAAAPPPGGSSQQPSTGDASPTPLVPAPGSAIPMATQASAESKPEFSGDKTAAPAPQAAVSAQLPAPKAEPARAASPSIAADSQASAPPADTPAPLATAQAAAGSPSTSPAAEKPAKTTHGRREEATPATSASGPTVRPGPTSTVAAAAQNEANKDPGEGSADHAAPQATEAQGQTTDPQLVADPTAQQPSASAATPAHAAAAAATRATPETVATLAGQIVKKLGAQSTQFDLQLDPAGLGKVNVRIEINADGRVSAAMSFDTPQAAAELKARANELQRALAQSGFDVTGGLTFDVTQDQGRGSGQQNAFQNNENTGQAFRGRAFAAALETAGDAAQAALIDRRATPSGVDVRI
jgi:hypothetical protein